MKKLKCMKHMKQKLTLALLFICTLSVWQMKGQTGADCSNAIGILQPSSQTYASGVYERWYQFDASSTTLQIEVTQRTNQVNVRKIELYTGTCSALTLLGRDSLTSSTDTAVSIQVSNLTIPTIYYARVIFIPKVNNYDYNLALASPAATNPLIIWENPDGTSGYCGGSGFTNPQICETTICLGEAICFSYNIQFFSPNYGNYALNHTTLYFSDGGSIVVENTQYTGPNPTGCVHYTPTAVGTITTTGVNNSVFAIHVIAPTVPLYSVSIPNPVCLGECVLFTSLNSPVANYSFTSNDPYTPCPSGQFGTLGNSFIFTNPGTNTVIYTINAGHTCAQTFTIPVIVITPSITLTSTIIPCTLQGTFSASLSCNAANGGTNFTWNIYNASSTVVFTDNNGFNSTVNYTFTSTGTYTVECIYYLHGIPITTTQTITVTVPTAPTITTNINIATICLGNSVTFFASVATTYTWSTGANTSSISVSPTVTTIYTVTGTNACGLTGSKTVTVTLYPPQGPINVTATPNPICAGTPVLLQASGALSYTFTGLGAANNISVTPTVTTTYTVFGSNGICASTQSAVVTVTVVSPTQSTISISQSVPYPCIGTSITLTANVTPVGTYTYNWSAPINQTGQVVTFMPIENVNYVCTVTGVCGNIGNSKTCISVVSNKCCLSAETGLNNVTLTGSNPLSNINGGAYKVFGTITITGNVNWINTEFRMQLGSKIVIMPGGVLTLRNCQLYSCANMWEGIVLQAGTGGVTPKIIVNNTSIEDAWKAMHYDAQNDNWRANILTTNSTFNKNYIGVSVENVNPVFLSATNDAPTMGDKFDGTVSLNSPGNYLKCSSFYTPTIKRRPYAGVYFDNQLTDIHIGDATFNPINTNTFTTMDYGIYTKNSTVRSLGNKYTNLTGINWLPSNIGIGVYAVNTTTTLNHQLDVSNCTFTNVWRGVDVSNITSFVVVNSIFTSSSTSGALCTSGCIGSVGVISTNPIQHGHVYNSYISNYSTGVANFYSIPTVPSYTFGIGQNTITATSAGLCRQAISVQSAANNYTTSPASISIANNQISNVINGVLSNNIKSGLRISNNTVNLQYAALGNRFGIRCTGTENAWIDNNTINGGGTANINLSGIYMQLSPNCKTQCNTISNTGNCVVYQGNNASNVVGFVNNSMNNSSVGLKLTNNGVIGNQGNSGFILARRNSGNTWNGTFTFKTFTFNSTAQTSKLFVQNSPATLPGPAITNTTIGGSTTLDRYGVTGVVAPPTLITQFAPLSTQCPLPLTQAAKVAPFLPLNNMAQLAAQDSALVSLLTNTIAITPAAQYLQKEFVFALLKRPQITTTDVSLQNFALANLNTGLGHYLAVDSLIKNGQYTLAQTKNSTAVITSDIEQNKNDINKQLLKKLVNDAYAYTTSEVQLVETIANKCPLSDGNGVYQARTLLQIIKNKYIEFTDSCDTEPNGARLSHTDEDGNIDVEQFAENFLLFPNPNNGNMQVLYNLNKTKQASITIFDIHGKVIFTKTLDSEANLTQLTLDGISNGVYYYQIIGDTSNVLKSDKLIIIK